MKTSLAKKSDGALSLMQRVLRDGGPITAEYPTIFEAEADGTFVTIEVEGEVRAACVIVARDLVVPNVRVRAGLIGSVATDPRHQKRGLGTQLVDAACAALRERGCVVGILWADDSGFYQRRGWREFGCERDFIVSPEDLDSLPVPRGIRALRPTDIEVVHALYERHERRVARKLGETRALMACPGMVTLVCDLGGEVSAYACLGRGHDLHDVVHEWGGQTDDVLRLIRAHLEKRMEAGSEAEIYVMAPGAHGELQGRLALAGVPSSIGVLGMARVIDAEGLAQVCAQALGPRGLVRVKPAEKESIEFIGPAGRVLVPNEDLLDLALAARGERGVARTLAKNLGIDDRGLPLLPFVWGLDSI